MVYILKIKIQYFTFLYYFYKKIFKYNLITIQHRLTLSES